MTRVKTFFVLVALGIAAGGIYMVGGYKLLDRRECGDGKPARSAAAYATWQNREDGGVGQVSIVGLVGRYPFNEPKVSASPYKASSDVCPGDPISIHVTALNGPLLLVRCDLTIGGSYLTGSQIHRENVIGQRALCEGEVRF